jgi:hypothetical protein
MKMDKAVVDSLKRMTVKMIAKLNVVSRVEQMKV